VRLFSQTESELFESLFHEKLHPIRDRHFTEIDRIHWSNSPHKLNLLISEHKRFKKEFIEARIQAYVETCSEITRYPDRLDYQEFAAELAGLAHGATDDISRAYNDPLSPIRAQSLERTLEILELELGQIVGPAMAPVRRLVAEGKLAAPQAEGQGGQVDDAAKRLMEFQEYLGEPCRSLGDLDWSVTKTFLDRIPTDLERIDFLQELGKLPDDGIANISIVDPAKHNRNTNAFVRPLRDECSRLLSRHFNLENILKQVGQISENGEALSYLWGVLRVYKKYHPGTRQNHYSPNELAFCQTIETEIEYRRDMQISLGASARRSPVHYNINIGENRGPIQQGGSGNNQSTSGSDDEVK
jgi:hypothetical protein